MFQFLHRKPPSKQRGNAMTFLLLSMVSIGFSMSVTSMMMGPMAEKNPALSSKIAILKTVADHHLDRIEKYMQSHPEAFFNEANFDTTDSVFTLGTPTAQRMSRLAFDANFPDNSPLRAYQETLQLKQQATIATVTSRMVWDDRQKHYTFMRLKAPYDNTFKMTVDVTWGLNHYTNERLVTLPPPGCQPAATTASAPLSTPPDPNSMTAEPAASSPASLSLANLRKNKTILGSPIPTSRQPETPEQSACTALSNGPAIIPGFTPVNTAKRPPVPKML